MEMPELDDIALLREYVERDSEEAFAALVTRQLNYCPGTASPNQCKTPQEHRAAKNFEFLLIY